MFLREQFVPSDLTINRYGLRSTQQFLLAVLCTVLPSACVFPSDPTLTEENVTEVMCEVGDWERVAKGDSFLRRGLGVPNSRLQEIRQQPATEREKCRLLGEYWVNTDPGASWKKLAVALYEEGEERAAAMTKQYLPKGMCIL